MRFSKQLPLLDFSAYECSNARNKPETILGKDFIREKVVQKGVVTENSAAISEIKIVGFPKKYCNVAAFILCHLSVIQTKKQK